MMKKSAAFALCLLALAGQRANAQDDDEFRLAKGRQTFQNNCLMCHAAPIVASQRLTPGQWTAEVTKMTGWGAPVPEEEIEVLTEFLSRSFGVDAPKVRPARITIRAAETAIDHQNDEGGVSTLTGDATRGKKLYLEHCGKCHGNEGTGGELGTKLVQKPILDRWTDFRVVVRDGRNRMPGFRQAIDKDGESDILRWLQSAKPAAEVRKP